MIDRVNTIETKTSIKCQRCDCSSLRQ